MESLKYGAGFLNAGLMCILGLTNNYQDGGQLRAKPHLHKAKPNHVLYTNLALGWPPSIKSLVNPRVHVRPRLKYTAFKESWS